MSYERKFAIRSYNRGEGFFANPPTIEMTAKEVAGLFNKGKRFLFEATNEDYVFHPLFDVDCVVLEEYLNDEDRELKLFSKYEEILIDFCKKHLKLKKSEYEMLFMSSHGYKGGEKPVLSFHFIIKTDKFFTDKEQSKKWFSFLNEKYSGEYKSKIDELCGKIQKELFDETPVNTQIRTCYSAKGEEPDRWFVPFEYDDDEDKTENDTAPTDIKPSHIEKYFISLGTKENHDENRQQFPFLKDEKKKRKIGKKKEEKAEEKVEEEEEKVKKPRKSKFNQDCQDKIELIKELLNKLSNEVWTNFDSWREMVWAMKSLGLSLDDAKHYSQKTTKNNYDENEVEKLWDNYNDEYKYNLNCIFKYLKKNLDKEEQKPLIKKYKEVFGTWAVSPLEKILLEEYEEGLANLFLEHNKNYVMVNGETAYYFNPKTKLYQLVSTKNIQSSLVPTLRPILEEVISQAKQSASKEDLGEFYEFIQFKIARLKKILEEVLCDTKQRKITNIISKKHELYDSDFESKLNKVPHQAPLKNGKIIDFNTLEVRDRVYTDLWNMEYNVSYNPNYDKSIPEKYFRSLAQTTNPETPQKHIDEMYVYLCELCGFLMTGFRLKAFWFFIGSTNNGKSKLVELLGKIVGNFQKPLNKYLIIENDRKQEAPSASAMNMRNMRIGVFNELKATDKLDDGKIKEFTGGDTIDVRGLYQANTTQFKPSCRFLILLNEMLTFSAEQPALAKRSNAVPFNNTFKGTPDEEKYLDDLMENQLDTIFSFLCQYAQTFCKTREIKIPQLVKQETNEAIEENDPLLQFLKRYRKTNNNDTHYTQKDKDNGLIPNDKKIGDKKRKEEIKDYVIYKDLEIEFNEGFMKGQRKEKPWSVKKLTTQLKLKQLEPKKSTIYKINEEYIEGKDDKKKEFISIKDVKIITGIVEKEFGDDEVNDDENN